MHELRVTIICLLLSALPNLDSFVCTQHNYAAVQCRCALHSCPTDTGNALMVYTSRSLPCHYMLGGMSNLRAVVHMFVCETRLELEWTAMTPRFTLMTDTNQGSAEYVCWT